VVVPACGRLGRVATGVRARTATRRWRWPVLASMLALGGVVLAAALVSGGRPLDLAVYLAGGDAVMHGRPLYDAAGPHGLLFTYPPFAALLVTPLVLVPAPLAAAAVTAGSLALLARLVAVGLPDRAVRARWLLPLTVAALALEPVRLTLQLGQVNLLVVGAVVLDATSDRIPRRARGVLTGLAAAVKLTPLVLLPYLVLTGRRRAAATAAATALGATLLATVALPHDTARYWLHVLSDPHRIGSAAYAGNSAYSGLVARVEHRPQPAGLAWFVGELLLIGVGLAVAVLAHRTDARLGLCLTGLTGLLVSPISWTHHWVWLVPLAVVVADLGRRGLAALVVAVAVVSPQQLLPRGGDAEYAFGAGRLAADSAYLLLGVLLLLVLAREDGRHGAAAHTGGPFRRPA